MDQTVAGVGPSHSVKVSSHILVLQICFDAILYCIAGVFLQFGGSTIANASFRVQLDTIGEGVGGLVCRTDHPQCCNETSNSAWLTPNNTVVPSTRGESDFYTDTGDGFIRLNLIRNTTTATGEYCCRVPVATMETFCAQLFLPEPQGSSKTIQEPL